MWSIGVITYILLGGYPPFHDDNQKALFKKIKNAEYEFHDEYWSEVSEEAKDLIRHLLKINPVERYTAEEALNHPWVRGLFTYLLFLLLHEFIQKFTFVTL
jgi:serine/threonine protein kinase